MMELEVTMREAGWYVDVERDGEKRLLTASCMVRSDCKFCCNLCHVPPSKRSEVYCAEKGCAGVEERPDLCTTRTHGPVVCEGWEGVVKELAYLAENPPCDYWRKKREEREQENGKEEDGD